jgi:Tol biopolymer transport system component
MQEDLHLYNLFTGERRIVTADPRWSEYFPAWSPDGRQLAYIAEEEDGEGGPGGTAADRSVHLTRWDGQENRLVARQVSDVCPAFSPDGELLAYACKDSLKVCAWKSREHRKLITGVQPFGESSRALQWSPDGQWIAFVGVPVENGTYVPDYERLCFVYLVHRSGHPVRRLTRAQADLAWLPDNRLIINEIARWDTERGTHTGAVVVDVSGSVVQDLLVVSHESGVAEDGTTVPDYKREPWPASRLPLLPTLPGTAVSIVREGRNW